MKVENEEITKLRQRAFSAQSNLLNRMFFGGNVSTSPAVTPKDSNEVISNDASNCKINGEKFSRDKISCNSNHTDGDEKKNSTDGVGGRNCGLFANARNSLRLMPSPIPAAPAQAVTDENSLRPLEKLGKEDPTLGASQEQNDNSVGESQPGLCSTFTVGVWEDRNKKCRRTMEDTHVFLYNFLHNSAPTTGSETLALDSISREELGTEKEEKACSELAKLSAEMTETDNGYFAIFDGHAGSFAADWCSKKLHIILEDMIRTNPDIPIPELLDQTFTSVDAQLEKLPLKNSGCTAAIAILRWEDRISNPVSTTESVTIAPSIAALETTKKATTIDDHNIDDNNNTKGTPTCQNYQGLNIDEEMDDKYRSTVIRQRVLYTANVGDARIILCRKGKALRLSYDHKGSDENEGKRVANAGGLILNNRVNGVLAVTRALGDNYMKDLVTGHPYTTETVIQPGMDEFIILACDGVSFPSVSHIDCYTDIYLALGCV